jgi:hypothetical protein
MNRLRFIAGFAFWTLAIAQARGHDTGFGHSRRTLVFSAKPEEFVLEYRIALSADEALVEMTRMDRDGDGRISPEEKERYFADRAREIARGWEVTTAEGERLQPVRMRVELGHSLTQSYRFTVSTVDRTIFFVDTNFSHKPGQVSVLCGPGLKAEPQTPSNLAHAERISIVVTRQGR